MHNIKSSHPPWWFQSK